MTSEIVRREPTLTEKMDWSKALATSTLLPRQYQNNPGNLLFAVEYADALGVSRINAITSIHVIEGKPSASADLIASLVRRAGHKLRLSGDDTYALAQIIRADDPDHTFEARWDLAKAQTAGLLGKSVWKQYPGAMLRSRAITEVARMGASDALFGVIYTPEELGAEVDPDGDVVHHVTAVQETPVSGAQRMREVLGTQPAAEEASAEPVEKITPPQVKKIATAMGELGLADRASALAFVNDVIGHPVESRNDLTKDEASRVIDALERDLAAEPVDAEIVPDTPPTLGSEDAIWQEIVTVAGDLNMQLPDLQADFKTRLGCIPDEASTVELAKYLEILSEQGAA